MTNTAQTTKVEAIRLRVASNFRAELRRKGLTTRSTASALGLTQPYVNRRTSGMVELSASDLELFSEFLRIPMSRFFLDDGTEPEVYPVATLTPNKRPSD